MRAVFVCAFYVCICVNACARVYIMFSCTHAVTHVGGLYFIVHGPGLEDVSGQH